MCFAEIAAKLCWLLQHALLWVMHGASVFTLLSDSVDGADFCLLAVRIHFRLVGVKQITGSKLCFFCILNLLPLLVLKLLFYFLVFPFITEMNMMTQFLSWML